MFCKLKAFLLYLILIAVFYAPVVFLGKSLHSPLYQPYGLTASWPHEYKGRIPVNTFNIDLATPVYYEWPVNKLIGNLYRKGDLPLWNPYQGAGTPLAAQYSTRAFFPYQILEDMSPIWLWDAFILGRPLIAGFFTYLLLAVLGLEFAPAFLGGLLYMFSGVFAWFINLEQFTNVAMMLPVHIYCLEKLARRRGLRDLALAALSFGLVLVAGQPETALYALMLGVSYYFFRVALPFALKRNSKEMLRYCLAAVLGFALAAPLVIPFIEYMGESYSLHPSGGDMGVREPMKLYKAFQILTPFEIPLGASGADTVLTPSGERFSFKIFAENGIWDFIGGYTGAISILLSVTALFLSLRWRSRWRPLLLFFLIFGLVIVFKNLGVRPFIWIGLLPFFDQVWSQRWAGPVWVFCLSVAGAIGFQIIKESVTLSRRSAYACIAMGFISVLAVYSVLMTANLLELKKAIEPMIAEPGVYDLLKTLFGLNPYFGASMFTNTVVTLTLLSLSAAVIVNYFRSGRGIYSLIPLAGFELWWAVARGYDERWTLLKLLLAAPMLLVFAGFILNRWRIAVAGTAAFFTAFLWLDSSSPRGFPDRHDPFTAPAYINALKADGVKGRVIGGHGALFPNFASAVELEDLRYVNSLSPSPFHEFKNRFLQLEDDKFQSLWFTGSDHRGIKRIELDIVRNLRYYSFLGVRHIILPSELDFNGFVGLFYGSGEGLSEFPLKYSGEGISVYENPYALPRAFIARKVRYVSSYKDAHDEISLDNFDLAGEVALEERLPAGFASEAGPVGRAEITEYGANRVTIRASVENDSVLVLTDVFYPGWKAYDNGEAAKIYRVNGIVRGVFLRSGEHTVVFRYFPLSFLAGAVLFFISLSLIGALLLMDKYRPLFYERPPRPVNDR